MTITLHLGVVDQPYDNRGAAKHTTTGDVAEWLENKYHVMEVFFELHGQDVGASVESALAGAIETALMGGPFNVQLGSATSDIERMFRKYLESGEIEGLGIPGVPTQAALEGINHRMKSGKGTPGRPSFIDTALYENSFTAWVDNT